MKKGIEINGAIIDRILNGAKKFIVPITGNIEFNYIKEGAIDMIIEDVGDTSLENVGHFSTEERALSYFTKNYSPLKKGDEFFAQEEFCKDELEVYYRALESDECAANTKWESPSMMKANESRLPNLVLLDIETKRVDDILSHEFKQMGYTDIDVLVYSSIKAFNKENNMVSFENPYVYVFTFSRN